jgi:hypothetical protein
MNNLLLVYHPGTDWRDRVMCGCSWTVSTRSATRPYHLQCLEGRLEVIGGWNRRGHG